MKTHIVYIFLLLISCASCATTIPYEDTADGRLDRYVSQDYYTFILDWGPPDYVYSDGRDGRILEWDYSYNYSTPSASYSISQADWDDALYNDGGSISGTTFTVGRPAQMRTAEHFIQLYVDDQGVIHHYRHNVQTPEESQARASAQKQTYWLKVTGYTLGITAVALLALNAGEQEY